MDENFESDDEDGENDNGEIDEGGGVPTVMNEITIIVPNEIRLPHSRDYQKMKAICKVGLSLFLSLIFPSSQACPSIL